jgi:Cu-Zn family superoxide dismutase
MSVIRLSAASAVAAGLALVAACGSQLTTAPSAAPSAAPSPSRAAEDRTRAEHAVATLRDASGAEVGTARFTQDATGRVHLNVQVRGVSAGRHGLHLHAAGACAAGPGAPFASAGAHYNPGGRQHGHHNPQGHHAGDLPNVEVNAAGGGHLNVALGQFALADLADADGTALVLHQNEDDQVTNTGPNGPGNSGPRIACGVVAAR